MEGSQHRFTEPLLDFIPRLNPGFAKPVPFTPYLNLIERSASEPIRATVAGPPQHGKTVCGTNGLVWLLKANPGRRHAYATYQHQRSVRVANKTKALALRAGLEIGGTQDYWTLPCGGSVIWTSVRGALTGEGIDGLLLIDDPFKDRKEADSTVIRQHVHDWYDDVADTRLHTTASVIEMATRWHQSDLTGYLVKHHGFPYVNLKAIADDKRPEGDDREPGQPLWEQRKTLEELERKRSINLFSFASLYQGEPRPRGGAMFGEPSYYDTLPSSGYRVGFGVDLAYTEKTHADFSVCVEAWYADGVYFITDVRRAQVEAPSFCLTLRAKHSQRKQSKFFWYAAGTEKGAGDFIKAKGIPLKIVDPGGRDKFTRAQNSAELWNDGKILVPSHGAEWVDTLVDEVCGFTGVNDACDDQVDALVAVIDRLAVKKPAPPRSMKIKGL